MGKEELHFATCFSAKQTTENGKEVLRLAFCDVLRRNKHALNTIIIRIWPYFFSDEGDQLLQSWGRLKLQGECKKGKNYPDCKWSASQQVTKKRLRS